MLTTNWPTSQGVNSRFFGFNSKPKDNVELTEFMSGRVIGRQVNTKKIMTYSCQVRFSKQELNTFWSWFNDTLGQTAGAFYCPALGTSLYRFTSVPDPQDTDLSYRTLSLEIEEVF